MEREERIRIALEAARLAEESRRTGAQPVLAVHYYERMHPDLKHFDQKARGMAADAALIAADPKLDQSAIAGLRRAADVLVGNAEQKFKEERQKLQQPA